MTGWTSCVLLHVLGADLNRSIDCETETEWVLWGSNICVTSLIPYSLCLTSLQLEKCVDRSHICLSMDNFIHSYTCRQVELQAYDLLTHLAVWITYIHGVRLNQICQSPFCGEYLRQMSQPVWLATTLECLGGTWVLVSHEDYWGD